MTVVKTYWALPNDSSINAEGKALMNAHSVSLASTADEELHVIEGTGSLVFSPDYKRLHFDLHHQILTLDIENQTIIQEYSFARSPRVAGTSPDGNFLYVSDSKTSKILVIDTQAQTVTEGYEIGVNSDGMVVSPDGSKLFVASEESAGNFLLVIDSTKQTLIKRIAAGRDARCMALHPQRPRVYIACFGVLGDGNGVYAIDTNTYQVTHIPLEDQGWYMALTPTGDELYVSQSNAGSIAIIDTLNNGVKKTFVAVETPGELAFSLDGKWLYMITDNRIDVFDTQNQQFVRSIHTSKLFLEGIQTRKDNGALWVAGRGASNELQNL